MGKHAKERLRASISGPFCLCIGSGATVQYVGTWKTLLGKLLAKKFESDLPVPSGGGPGSSSGPLSANDFSDFFVDESYLEVGEFLLTDGFLSPPSGLRLGPIEWQERSFADLIRGEIQASVRCELGKRCGGGIAPYCGSCPLNMHVSDAGSACRFSDMYRVYRDSASFAADDTESQVACPYIKKYATTMAAVELCARRNLRYVVSYNFDTVVEEMLCEVLEKGLVTSDIREIHVWTYPDGGDPSEIISDGHPRIVFHRGGTVEDAAAFNQRGAIHFFHVHGVASGPGMGDVASPLVFSQHSYQVYQEAYLNWSNSMLLALCSRLPLVSVGFSGSDPNFRFFVKGYRRSGMKGLTPNETLSSSPITILKAAEPYCRAIRGRVTGRQRVRTFLGSCKRMVSSYYKTYFDIDTIWVDSYFDVAKVLHVLATET